MIEPHGGRLINRITRGDQREELIKKAIDMPEIDIDLDELTTLENLASGLFSPLEGFMVKEEYINVIENMRLTDGIPWSLPVVLGVSAEEASKIKEGQDVGLYLQEDKQLYGVLHLLEKYTCDKQKEAQLVYKTTDIAHPGVAAVYKRDDILLGGKITLINKYKHLDFNNYRFEPEETRKMIKEKNWNTVVAFQTRNPIHRAHEYLQKCALEMVDGLFLSPLVGRTKSSDIPADVRIRSYEIVLEKYYPANRTMLVVFPVAMRYAGPREAIFHAICRKNYGCSHFIVGRDHAGVGDYYGTYEAQEIFDQFSPEEIGIKPLKFEYTFYCKKCGNMASKKTCPHSDKEHIYLSGTKVRELLRSRIRPPLEMTRPEVADVLIEGMKNIKET
jgi:sulfate adenylyltransferase